MTKIGFFASILSTGGVKGICKCRFLPFSNRLVGTIVGQMSTFTTAEAYHFGSADWVGKWACVVIVVVIIGTRGWGRFRL